MPDAEPLESKPKPRRYRWLTLTIRIFLLLVLLGGFAVWFVMIRMPGASFQGELPAADDPLKSLAEELRNDVQKLSGDIGERNLRHRPKELAAAADYIEGQFKALGLQTSRQTYEVAGIKCSNLIGEMPGKSKPQEIVVIGAHYDTAITTPGANDNTSGTAAMLALARRISKKTSDRTLRFVAFVNEEPPYFQTELMGSLVYAKSCRQNNDNIVAMLSLEMLGYYSDEPNSQAYPPPVGLVYPSTANFICFVSNTSSRDLTRQIVGKFRAAESFPSEGAALPAGIPGVGFSDQWSFWQAGYPAMMVTDTAFYRYRHYHRPEDTIDKLDFDRFARVVRGLEPAIDELVGGGELR